MWDGSLGSCGGWSTPTGWISYRSIYPTVWPRTFRKRSVPTCETTSSAGAGLRTDSGLIAFGAGNVGKLDPAASESERMTTVLDLTIWRQAGIPDEARDQLTLDLIAHIPWEDIVYFRTCGRLTALKDLHVRMPDLEALDLRSVPLYPTLSVLDSQDGSQAQERFPPSLQHLFLEELILNGYDWVHLIAFLFRRASSGNGLDSFRNGGPCHMCAPVGQRICGMVRRLKIEDGCRESWCPFGSCLRETYWW